MSSADKIYIQATTIYVLQPQARQPQTMLMDDKYNLHDANHVIVLH